MLLREEELILEWAGLRNGEVTSAHIRLHDVDITKTEDIGRRRRGSLSLSLRQI